MFPLKTRILIQTETLRPAVPGSCIASLVITSVYGKYLMMARTAHDTHPCMNDYALPCICHSEKKHFWHIHWGFQVLPIERKLIWVRKKMEIPTSGNETSYVANKKKCHNRMVEMINKGDEYNGMVLKVIKTFPVPAPYPRPQPKLNC